MDLRGFFAFVQEEKYIKASVAMFFMNEKIISYSFPPFLSECIKARTEYLAYSVKLMSCKSHNRDTIGNLALHD